MNRYTFNATAALILAAGLLGCGDTPQVESPSPPPQSPSTQPAQSIDTSSDTSPFPDGKPMYKHYVPEQFRDSDSTP